jgi:lysophospholipid acyltransferase (LPLAT)-like uncharacterized protein
MAMGESSGWRFRSWAGFLVQRPFSTIQIEYGPPVYVPREADRGVLDALGRRLGDTLNAMTDRLNPEGTEPPMAPSVR